MGGQTKNSMGCYKSFIASLIALLVFRVSTASGQFRQIVALQVNNRFKCGGSFVSEMHIVTGAQCVAGVSPKNMTVVLYATIPDVWTEENVDRMVDEITTIHGVWPNGDTDRLGVQRNEATTTIPDYWVEGDTAPMEVQRIKTHPEFKNDSGTGHPVNDIAVVTLDYGLLATCENGRIPLPSNNDILGRNAAIIYWWSPSVIDDVMAQMLDSTIIPFVNKTDCTAVVPDVSMHICVTIEVEDSYKGARPGDGVIYNRKLIGLVTQSTQRVGNDLTYVIMQIEPYIDFINGEVTKDIPEFDVRTPVVWNLTTNCSD